MKVCAKRMHRARLYELIGREAHPFDYIMTNLFLDLDGDRPFFVHGLFAAADELLQFGAEIIEELFDHGRSHAG